MENTAIPTGKLAILVILQPRLVHADQLRSLCPDTFDLVIEVQYELAQLAVQAGLVILLLQSSHLHVYKSCARRA